MAATRMKDRGRDAFEHVWKRIKPELNHLYVEEIDTSALDAFKQTLPKQLGPKSVNQYLILIRAVLRYLWKRAKLRSVPYIPMESVPKLQWYTAVDWHVARGYVGPEFLFSKTGAFPRYIDSHARPLKLVQQKLGLRLLSHHKVGRHSVASQAVTGGESIKAVQAQLGHVS